MRRVLVTEGAWVHHRQGDGAWQSGLPDDL